jgi:hypothetical protein
MGWAGKHGANELPDNGFGFIQALMRVVAGLNLIPAVHLPGSLQRAFEVVFLQVAD